MWLIARENGTDELAVRQETTTLSFGLSKRDDFHCWHVFMLHFLICFLQKCLP